MESSVFTPAILQAISRELNIAIRSLVPVIELLGEGGTVPFIARYRKEATGNLDEVQIRAIVEPSSEVWSVTIAVGTESADGKFTVVHEIDLNSRA